MKPIRKWLVQLVDNNFIRCDCNYFTGLSKDSSKFPLLRFCQINGLAMEPLPEGDVRFLNAEVNRRRLEIDTLKWTTARNQPFGIRDKKEDQPQAQTFTISWSGGDTAINAHEDEEVLH